MKYAKKFIVGILIIGVLVVALSSKSTAEEEASLGQMALSGFEQNLYHSLLKNYATVITYETQENDREYYAKILPIYSYIYTMHTYDMGIESELTYDMIRKQEGQDEEHVAQATAGENNKENVSAQKQVNLSMEKLADYDYLVQNFYTIDRTTTITGEQLNAADMMAKDMSLTENVEGPQVLIYHTHSQEGYVDSVAGDLNTTVVGVGAYLAELLTTKYGIQVLHHQGTYDVAQRDYAYSAAEPALEQILAENPSIEVVIDLHRDGVAEDTHLVTDINGTQMATIMFFNGLSRTTALGEITYLPNPYIADNLAFSFQMQLAAAEYYPGLTRPIYLKGYRYNMHMRPKSMLVEVGAQTNTLQEAKNAMVPLADLLSKVLTQKH